MHEGPVQHFLLKLTQRQDRLHLATIILYLAPLLILTTLTVWIASPSAGWPLVPVGLFFAGAGSLAILTLWRLREGLIQIPQPKEPYPEIKTETLNDSPDSEEKILRFQQSLEEYRQEQARYVNEIDEKNESLARLMQENSLLHSTLDGAREKHQRETHSFVEQIQQQKTLLEEYQHTINNQRQELSKHEQTIASLENKLRDLSFQLRDQKYEIKTLLQLADITPENSTLSHGGDDWLEEPAISTFNTSRNIPELDANNEEFINSPGEASLILKRCLDIARKITGPSYFSPSHAPFGHPSPASHTLDLRRFCDSLRSERGAIVLVFSPKEDKLLFASPTIKHLTGWSPDKFMQDFHMLMGEQAHEWRNAVRRLPIQGETTLSLHITSKEHHPIKLNALLATIPTGLFRLHVLAILFPSS